MDKKRILGIISFVILLISLIFAYGTPYSTPIGDTLLRGLKLEAWSNGNVGLHYTFFYAVILFMIGLYGTTRLLKEYYPTLVKRLPLIILLVIIVYPLLTSVLIKTVKSNAEHLYAVHYIRDDSNIHFYTDNNILTIDGELKLRNYSQQKKKFYIKYIANDTFMEAIDLPEELIALDEKDRQQVFYLPPETTQVLDVHFRTMVTEDIQIEGQSKAVDISIFNVDNEISFHQGMMWGVTVNR